jgi:hypothetical protein
MSHYYVSTTRLGQEKLLILLRLSFLFYLPFRGMSQSFRKGFRLTVHSPFQSDKPKLCK